MGRPPCCDKVDVKKGPWTPEEDIILVSYIQEHGPGNWKVVPTNTGLMRCSKSCRLRWTNYLRPGIKRGNFSGQEEKLIIHLQALLGNRWAAIASYLPERTDNDIKNYWNTHLRKKLKKVEADGDDGPKSCGHSSYQSMSKGQWEMCLQTDINMAKRALREALSMEKADRPSDDSNSSSSDHNLSDRPYASSTENISRLLKSWMRNSPNPSTAGRASSGLTQTDSSSSQGVASTSNCMASPESLVVTDSPKTAAPAAAAAAPEGQQAPFSVLESWLFDDSVEHGHENLLDISTYGTCELF